ncbi:MAG: beta-N-acetylhexosaminidase [Rhodospirillaceae bacterium]|nr:beta-N-acetylhexosaminidase [Rhodospirillaceae bacterium]
MLKNKIPSAVIYGCAGLSLSDEEKCFFNNTNPFGFILFSRNIATPIQVMKLVNELRNCVEHHAPILIDQEGGAVQRLKEPYWHLHHPMEIFGKMAEKDLSLARRATWLNARIMANELSELGINVNCAPVLDLKINDASNVIGNRSFGNDPVLVADLGRSAMEGLLDGTVISIVKHTPGHGRALVDSHKELPVVETNLKTLEQSDFLPFRSLRDAPWAMTAHIVYKAIDSKRPATISKIVIKQIIRDAIGCESVLLSDDISMKSLSGSFSERAQNSLDAGCDIVLHCNGKIIEMQNMASALRPLSDNAQIRLSRADSMLRNYQLPIDANITLESWISKI